MKQNIQDGIAMAMVFAGVLLVMAVEGGAKATVLALDGIAVVVNPGNTTDDLTVDQIKGIYTGELTTWADVQ